MRFIFIIYSYLLLIAILHGLCGSIHPAVDELLSFQPSDTDEHITCMNVTRSSGSTVSCCMTNHRGLTKGRRGAIKCLPEFLIAGTQKSGTTALAAMLSSHPLISFAPKKEVHYFDRLGTNSTKKIKNKPNDKLKDKSTNKNLYKHYEANSYLRSFNAWNYTDSLYYDPPYYGEATPFYVASPGACYNINKYLPNVKMIILLREPSARAYSEYHMKKRRVEQQDSFIDLMNKNIKIVFNCLISPNTNTFKKIKNCLPSNITTHYHFTKFHTNFRNVIKSSNKHKTDILNDNIDELDNLIIDKSISMYQNIIKRCFHTTPEKDNKSNYYKDIDSRRPNKSKNKIHGNIGNSRNQVNTMNTKNTIITNELINNLKQRNKYKNKNLMNNRKLYNDQEYDKYEDKYDNEYMDIYNTTGYKYYEYIDLNYLGNIYNYTKKYEDSYIDHNQTRYKDSYIDTNNFKSDKYYNLRYSNRNLQNIDMDRQHHLDTDNIFNNQSQIYFHSRSCLSGGAKEVLKSLTDAFQAEIVEYKRCIGDISDLSLKELTKLIISKCVDVKSGIASQYFYRSLYAPQLYHCFKFLRNKNNFFIITSEELQMNPEVVIPKIFQFIGIDINQYDKSFSDVETFVRQFFPKFESITGWRLKSEYDPMPSALSNYLHDFFQPYNKMLYDLLNVNYDKYWYNQTKVTN